MEIEKNNRINSLFEFYETLLTEKQKSYIQLYYGDDFSLGEIADEFSVSRQAVYDNIKRTEKILESYEQKLNLYRDFMARNRQFDQVRDYVAQHYENDSTLMQMITNLAHLEAE